MAVIGVSVAGLFFIVLFTVAGSIPKTSNGFDGDNAVEEAHMAKQSSPEKELKVLQIPGRYPSEVVKALQENLAHHKPTSPLMIDKLIPESYKVIFTIKLRQPLSGYDVIQQITEAVAKHANMDLNSVKVSNYDPYTGTVKMFFLYTVKQNNDTDVVQLRSAAEVLEHLTLKKRLQNAGNGIKIVDIQDADEYAFHYPNGKKVSVESIFSGKNWEAWQLAVLISACLVSIFFIFVVTQMVVSAHRLNKVTPFEEPRHVVLQPILRPAVADVGIIQPQPEIRSHPIAAAVVDTDAESTRSPSRSPMRRGRGLLERRGSNASLTLDLNRSQENIHCGTPPKECSAEEYLQSASKRMNRRQLRSSLRDVRALYNEFWEIPMNHPEKVEIAGSGTKNRYKTILPNETSRVPLYEKNGDPLSSYINANYVRGYSGEMKAYIATQGPLAHTIVDFWLMVWKEKSPLIVMITKLKEKLKAKCEPYIPEYEAKYGDIEVTVTRCIPCDGFTVRNLILRRGDELHTVHHFWYTTWPDHKTPTTAKQLLGMAMEAERLRTDDNGVAKGPVIVHCSAGIGRTGCFIAASIGIQQLLEENSVDILGTVCSLRLDRGGMIQTAEQYEFVHQALNIFEVTLPGSLGD